MFKAEVDVKDRMGRSETVYVSADSLAELQRMCALEEQAQRGRGAQRINVRVTEPKPEEKPDAQQFG